LVYSFGKGTRGELGLGKENILTPHPVFINLEQLTDYNQIKVIQIFAGVRRSFILLCIYFLIF